VTSKIQPINPNYRKSKPSPRVGKNPDRIEIGSRESRKFVPRRKSRVGLLFGLLILSAIVYFAGHGIGYFRRPQVVTTQISMGSLVAPRSFVGLIVRDERVIYAPSDGLLVMHHEDGRRVRVGGAIASVQDSHAAAQFRASLAGLSQEAIAAQRNRTGISVNDEEIEGRNGQIAFIVNQASFDLAVGDVGAIQELGSRITDEVEMRNQLFFVDWEVGDNLVAARHEAFTGLSSATDTMFAQNSGIVTRRMDGLENIFTPANLANIPRSQIAEQPPARAASEIVLAGDPIARIIESNIWHIAAYLPMDATAGWTENSSVTLYVAYANELLALNVIITTLRTEGLERYVVFRSSQELTRFLDKRSLSFQVERRPQQGLVIPETAIIERTRLHIPTHFVSFDGPRVTVTRRVGGGDEVLQIFGSLSANRQHFIVLAGFNSINIGDMLVSPEGEIAAMTDMDRVHGVYTSNRGFTVFRPINKSENFVMDGGYAALCPVLNSHLRALDWVVVNAYAVEDRQVLR